MPALPSASASPPPAGAASARASGSAPGGCTPESAFSKLLCDAGPTPAGAPAGTCPAPTGQAGNGPDIDLPDEEVADLLLGLSAAAPFTTPLTSGRAPASTSAPGATPLPGSTPSSMPTLAGLHLPGLAMAPTQAGADTPPLPASAPTAAAVALAGQNATPATLAVLAPAGDALSQAVPQAAAQGATAGATFETLIRDAAGPAMADSSGIEPAPLTATGAASTGSLTAARASPLAQPLPMPADPGAGFDDGLSTRIAWMAEQGIGRAELRVNPDHAGPIEVRLQMDGTRLIAEFSATNADTRQALEATMHRLRDMLGQQGLQLAQSHVGSGGGGQTRHDGSASGTAGGPGHADHNDIAPGDTSPARWVSRGLLDEYA